MKASNQRDSQSLSVPHARELELTAAAASGSEVARRKVLQALIPQVRRTMSYMVEDVQLAEDLEWEDRMVQARQRWPHRYEIPRVQLRTSPRHR